MPGARPSNLEQILALEVPVSVRLGERSLRVSEVTALAPGAIIELPKHADAELELVVNNKVVGCGQAVKVGEKFGMRITFIGDVKTRIAALGEGSDQPASEPSAEPESAESASAVAEALLAGQV